MPEQLEPTIGHNGGPILEPDPFGDIRAVTPKQAEEILGIGKSLLFDLIREKKIESFKVGRARRISLRSIRALQGQVAP